MSASAGATLEFAGGTFTLTSGTIGGAGTVALSSNAILALGSQNVTMLPGFSQSSGTLSGTGKLTLAGGAAFSGGYDAETGSGTTVLQGLSSITGSVTLDGGRVLENQGTLTWSSGYIYLGYNPSGTSLGGATVQNDAGAVFDIDTNGYQIVDETGAVSFVNAGTVAETAGSGTTIGVPVTNTGTVEVETGTLELTGTATNSGTFEAAGGTLYVANAIIGGGQLSIGTGGLIELGGAASETALFTGTSGTLKLDHPASYTGTLSGFAAGDILDLASTDATSATPGTFNGTTTTLTVNLSSGGPLTYILAGNYSSAVFSASFNGSDTDITLGPPPAPPIDWKSAVSGDWSLGSNWVGGVAPGAGDNAVVNVGGTYTVTISTAISADSLTLSDSQALVTETAGGSLTLTGALTLTAGTFQASTGPTTVGALSQSGGTLSGTGTITVTGGASFTSAYDAETGSGTTVLQGSSSIAGYVTLDGGRVLENQGTLTWSSGYIYLGYNPSGTSLGGATVQNDAGAVFDIDTNGYEILAETGTVSFVNAGTVAETAGTGTTIGVPLTNTGTVAVETGTLELDRRRVVERIGVERVGGRDPGVWRRQLHADQRHDRRGRDGGAGQRDQRCDPGAGLAECDDAAELQPVQRRIVGHRQIDAGRRGRLQRRVRCRDRFRDDGAAGFVVDHRLCDLGRRPGAGEPGHADLEQRLHLSRLQPVGHQPGRGDGAERRRCGLRHRHQRLPDRRRDRDGVVCQWRDGGGDGGERHDDRRAVDQHRDGRGRDRDPGARRRRVVERIGVERVGGGDPGVCRRQLSR